METRNVTTDTTIFTANVPLPGFGFVPVNSYLIKSKRPVLVDTNLVFESDEFMTALRNEIDPADLEWLYLTHPHPDHTGSMVRLLNEVPHLKLVTTFLAFGLIGLSEQIGPDRVYLLNPGETLDAGDRQLVCVKPATFDDPTTTAVYDPRTGVLFSSDSFGAILPEPAEQAEAVDREVLLQGQRLWTMMDSPWLHKVDERKFVADLKAIESLQPSWVLSSHLPPSNALLGEFIASIAAIPASEPFVMPNQAALEAMLAQMTAPAA